MVDLYVFVSQKWKSNRKISCESFKSAYKSHGGVEPFLFAAEQKQKARVGATEKDWLPAFNACIQVSIWTRGSTIPLIRLVAEPIILIRTKILYEFVSI